MKRKPDNPMPNLYREVDRTPCGEHPIDAAVNQRLRQTALQKRISKATKQMMEALGEKRSMWLKLEELLSEYQAYRAEAYFNIGFEHGLATGRTEVIEKTAGEILTKDGRTFTEHIRSLAIQANLPRHLAIAALLEASWALALNLNDSWPMERS